jgi:hypothetical protein
MDLAQDRYHRHPHRITICSTMAVVVGTRAPLLHHFLVTTVVHTIMKMRTIMAGWEDMMIDMHNSIMTIEDAIGVAVIGRITLMVAVILVECIVTPRIRHRDLSEVEIESEISETVLLVPVGCYSMRTRRSIVRIITITIRGTATKTVLLLVNIIILLLLLEAETEARVAAAEVVAGVPVEMEDEGDGCAQIAENEIIEDPAGGVEETTYTETTRDTRVSREPKSLDLADGIAMKIT